MSSHLFAVSLRSLAALENFVSLSLLAHVSILPFYRNNAILGYQLSLIALFYFIHRLFDIIDEYLFINAINEADRLAELELLSIHYRSSNHSWRYDMPHPIADEIILGRKRPGMDGAEVE